MRLNSTSSITVSVTAFQSLFLSLFKTDLEHLLNRHPVRPLAALQLHVQRSLSRSGVLLTTLFGWAVAASASPASSPLYPDTLRRYLSASGPTENDAYSTEYHSPVSRWIYAKHIWRHCGWIQQKISSIGKCNCN